LVTWRCV